MAYFVILGTPQGKARARTLKNGHSYTPDNTVLYENHVKQSFIASKDNETYFDDEPLMVCINAYFEIPKSITKKNLKLIREGKLFPTKKPDADNIGKVICDALNKVAYSDDKQIISLNVAKFYTEDVPRVNVGIYRYDEKKGEE